MVQGNEASKFRKQSNYFQNAMVLTVVHCIPGDSDAVGTVLEYNPALPVTLVGQKVDFCIITGYGRQRITTQCLVHVIESKKRTQEPET